MNSIFDIVKDLRKKALDDFVGQTPEDWADYKFKKGYYEGTLRALQNVVDEYKEDA